MSASTPLVASDNNAFADTLDPLLHQPLRTQIAAYLVGRGEASFSELKRILQCTDGNLDAHVKKTTGRQLPGPGAPGWRRAGANHLCADAYRARSFRRLPGASAAALQPHPARGN